MGCVWQNIQGHLALALKPLFICYSDNQCLWLLTFSNFSHSLLSFFLFLFFSFEGSLTWSRLESTCYLAVAHLGLLLPLSELSAEITGVYLHTAFLFVCFCCVVILIIIPSATFKPTKNKTKQKLHWYYLVGQPALSNYLMALAMTLVTVPCRDFVPRITYNLIKSETSSAASQAKLSKPPWRGASGLEGDRLHVLQFPNTTSCISASQLCVGEGRQARAKRMEVGGLRAATVGDSREPSAYPDG